MDITKQELKAKLAKKLADNTKEQRIKQLAEMLAVKMIDRMPNQIRK